MSNWNTTIICVALLVATGYSPVATAQVRAPFFAEPVQQPVPLPQTPPPSPPSKGPVGHKMPLPDATPTLDVVRYKAASMIRMRGELVGALRADGAVSFTFENGAIKQEDIAGKARGDYKYDRHGRLDRIEYSDGPTIQAHYGSQNELQSLTSDNGRTVRFHYGDGVGDGSAVAPTTIYFQSALALLRMQDLPHVLTTPLDQLLRNDGAGFDYFQAKEPTVTISAPHSTTPPA